MAIKKKKKKLKKKPLTNRARGPYWGILARGRDSTDRASRRNKAAFSWRISVDGRPNRTRNKDEDSE